MIPDSCLEVHTCAADRPSVPPWFAEVVIVAGYLAKKELLDAFSSQVRLVRGRLGSYEPLDFLALLIGYAVSGERRLPDFFDRLAPFGAAFMALCGRAGLPHRSSFSSIPGKGRSSLLRSVSHPLRAAQPCEMRGRKNPSEVCGIGRSAAPSSLLSMPHVKQRDNERCPVIQPFLPALRRLDGVCAPGYLGRKRGEVVRTRTVALQMHTRQWVGTYGGRGNGDYRGELASARHSIATYLRHFALSPQVAQSASRRAIWRCSSERPDYGGGGLSRDEGKRLSNPGASPAPARPSSIGRQHA